MHFNALAYLGYLESKQFCERNGIKVPSFPEYREAVSKAIGSVIASTGDHDSAIEAMKLDISNLQESREAYEKAFESIPRGDKLAIWACCEREGCLCKVRFNLAIQNPHIEV